MFALLLAAEAPRRRHLIPSPSREKHAGGLGRRHLPRRWHLTGFHIYCRSGADTGSVPTRQHVFKATTPTPMGSAPLHPHQISRSALPRAELRPPLPI